MLLCTVEPLNRGHVGDNINSAILSFIERLSSFRGSQCPIGKIIFGTSNSVLCREVYYTQCPYFGGSTIRGSTVFIHTAHVHACTHIYNVHVHVHAVMKVVQGIASCLLIIIHF